MKICVVFYKRAVSSHFGLELLYCFRFKVGKLIQVGRRTEVSRRMKASKSMRPQVGAKQASGPISEFSCFRTSEDRRGHRGGEKRASGRGFQHLEPSSISFMHERKLKRRIFTTCQVFGSTTCSSFARQQAYAL